MGQASPLRQKSASVAMGVVLPLRSSIIGGDKQKQRFRVPGCLCYGCQDTLAGSPAFDALVQHP